MQQSSIIAIKICCFYVKCYHNLIICFECCNPKSSIITIMVTSRIISTSQAVQDKLCTYYRSSLDQELQSNASSLYVIGYRTGMITASGALFIWNHQLETNICCNGTYSINVPNNHLLFSFIKKLKHNQQQLKTNQNSNQVKFVQTNAFQYYLITIFVGLVFIKQLDKWLHPCWTLSWW